MDGSNQNPIDDPGNKSPRQTKNDSSEKEVQEPLNSDLDDEQESSELDFEWFDKDGYFYHDEGSGYIIKIRITDYGRSMAYFLPPEPKDKFSRTRR
jgi:hypothetical protein